MESESALSDSQLQVVTKVPTETESSKLIFLGKPGGQYALRLVKPPFDTPDRQYYDEYEKLGDRILPKDNTTFEKYIISEATTYALEITLKEGFDLRNHIGIRVIVTDKATRTLLGKRTFKKNGATAILAVDTIHFSNFLNNSTVNGTKRNGVTLGFDELAPDEDQRMDTDSAADATSNLGRVQISIRKIGKTKLRKMSDDEYKRSMDKYKAHVTSLPTEVDEKNRNKHGITHTAAVLGGYEKGPLKEPSREQKIAFRRSSDHVEFVYICRSREYIQRNENKLYRSPVPLECFEWSSLKVSERRNCFKTLQAYDKAHTLNQAIAQANIIVDREVIQQELFETGDVPNRWRAWGHLFKREIEGCFRELQMRRQIFEKGEYPYNPRFPLHSQDRAISRGENEVKQDLQRVVLPDPVTVSVSEPKLTPAPEPTDIDSQASPIVIKAEPTGLLFAPPSSAKHQPIIILDDSDDDVAPLRAAKRSLPQSPIRRRSIKLEVVDLDAISPSNHQTRVAKRLKLDLEDHHVQLKVEENDNPEMLRLKEEDERIEEELFAAQKAAEAAMNVATLLRQRNENKSRIAALKAQSKPY